MRRNGSSNSSEWTTSDRFSPCRHRRMILTKIEQASVEIQCPCVMDDTNIHIGTIRKCQRRDPHQGAVSIIPFPALPFSGKNRSPCRNTDIKDFPILCKGAFLIPAFEIPVNIFLINFRAQVNFSQVKRHLLEQQKHIYR